MYYWNIENFVGRVILPGCLSQLAMWKAKAISQMEHGTNWGQQWLFALH